MHTVKLNQLAVSYKRSGFALGPISVDFGTGITSVVGVNGAGKSTLFNALIGTLPVKNNAIHFGALQRTKDVGFLPQSPVFPKRATCNDILLFAAWLHGLKKPQHRIAELLAQLGLTEHANKRTSELSGGMQRRLGIAQAIIHDPAVVLLDEPTAGLDPLQRIVVRQAITESLVGKVVLVSTHLVEDIRAISNQVLVLNHGKLVFHGSTQELEGYDNANLPGDSAFERALTHLYLGNQVA